MRSDRAGERCECCGHIVPEPLAPLDAKPRSHRDGPDTEKAAALRAWPKAESSCRRILDQLRAVDRDQTRVGRTWWELRDELGMYSAQPRLSDLKLGGWAKPSGVKRPTGTGALADCYVLTDQARDFYVKHMIAKLHDEQEGA